MKPDEKEIWIPTEETRAEMLSVMPNFGWRYDHDIDRRRGNSIYAVFIRDADIPNKKQLLKLEEKYFNLRGKRQTYEPMSKGVCVITFLCLIVPFFIYWGYKSLQKVRFSKRNAKLETKMAEVLQQAKALL